MNASVDRLFVAWREAGDADALAAVYDATAATLLRIALHHTRQPAVAEDLVQATFLAAIENAAGYDASRPLIGWLVGILHNKARHRMRSEGRAIDAARVAAAPPPDPLEVAAGAEFTAQVDEAIESLPEVYRPVLRLHLKHHLPAAEIAHALERPAGTVRSQLVRGLESLRAALPAGVALAGAFAALLPSRGLAAVREVVLAHGANVAALGAASAVGTVAATPVVVVGALTMKKLVVAAVAMLLAIVLGLELAGVQGQAAPANDDREPGAVASSPSRSVARDEVSASAAEVDRQPVPAAATTWQLVGTVRSLGVPLAGAQVEVHLGGKWGFAQERLAAGSSDERGDYVVDLDALRGLAPIDLDRAQLFVGTWCDGLAVEHEGDPAIDLPHRDVSLPLELRRDLDMVPACSVTGRVVDERGVPVAGAALHLYEGAALLGYYTLTDADGSFRIGVRESGEFTVRAEHDRFGLVEAALTSRPGEVMELGDLVMRAASSVRFRVVFEDGEPAAGIELWVGDYVSRADEHGRFVVARSKPGAQHVRIDHREEVLATLTPGDLEREIVLRGKHLVVPICIDEAGAELRPLVLQWDRFGREHDAQLTAFAAGAVAEELPGGRRGMGATRQFLLDRGDWLWLRASHGDAHGEALVHAALPENVLRPRIRIVERRRDAALRLILRCDDGGPVDALQVRVEQMRLGEPGATLAAEASEATGEGLVYRSFPGRYRLRVAPRAVDPRRVPRLLGNLRPFERIVDLVAGAEVRVEAVVATGGRVRLDVHAPGLRSGEELPLVIESLPTAGLSDGESRSYVSEDGGGWTERRAVRVETPVLWKPLLPPGRHLLTLRAPGYAETHLAVDIRSRQVTDLDVWLTKQ